LRLRGLDVEHDKIERAQRSTFVLAAMSFEATDLPFPTVVAGPVKSEHAATAARRGWTYDPFGFFRSEKLRTLSS
jgi:hypothetical protein